MNERKVVVLDLDDTMLDLKHVMCEALNKHTGKDITCDQWSSFNITEIYDNLHIDEFYNVIRDNNLLAIAEPLKNTKATLDKIRELGYYIVIITSRAYHEDAYEITEQWLDMHEIPYDIIHVSGNGIKKSYYANIYKNVVLAVDDNLDNCQDFTEKCQIDKVLLVNQPWNQNPNPFIRIDDISEALNYL